MAQGQEGDFQGCGEGGELLVGEPGCTLVVQRFFRFGLRLFVMI